MACAARTSRRFAPQRILTPCCVGCLHAVKPEVRPPAEVPCAAGVHRRQPAGHGGSSRPYSPKTAARRRGRSPLLQGQGRPFSHTKRHRTPEKSSKPTETTYRRNARRFRSCPKVPQVLQAKQAPLGHGELSYKRISQLREQPCEAESRNCCARAEQETGTNLAPEYTYWSVHESLLFAQWTLHFFRFFDLCFVFYYSSDSYSVLFDRLEHPSDSMVRVEVWPLLIRAYLSCEIVLRVPEPIGGGETSDDEREENQGHPLRCRALP